MTRRVDTRTRTPCGGAPATVPEALPALPGFARENALARRGRRSLANGLDGGHDGVTEGRRDGRVRAGAPARNSGIPGSIVVSSVLNGPGLITAVASITTSPGVVWRSMKSAAAWWSGRGMFIVEHRHAGDHERRQREASGREAQPRPRGDQQCREASANAGQDAARLRTPKMLSPTALTRTSPRGTDTARATISSSRPCPSAGRSRRGRSRLRTHASTTPPSAISSPTPAKISASTPGNPLIGT